MAALGNKLIDQLKALPTITRERDLVAARASGMEKARKAGVASGNCNMLVNIYMNQIHLGMFEEAEATREKAEQELQMYFDLCRESGIESWRVRNAKVS